MKKSDFWYDLPNELIAQQPLPARDGSRLMHLDRRSGAVRHCVFTDIVQMINPDDCIVINDSKVIPARVFGTAGGRKFEALLNAQDADGLWSALIKPARHAKVGTTIDFGPLLMEVVGAGPRGERTVRLQHEGSLFAVLDAIGHMPLPQYIKEKSADDTRYQTVYATHAGSVAAPTAGLHFTPQIIDQIEQRASIARVTLHVGMGTFLPVRHDDITEHKMHSEFCSISADAAAVINRTKSAGGRVIAIGTTGCRTIEAMANPDGTVRAGSCNTDIFIYPGYKFLGIDGLLTNFHLPESTLIMLVGAFAGRENTLAAYAQAVQERYRFFSFGDAMIVL